MEYDQCTQECTRVFSATDGDGDESTSNGLFIGGDAVARNRALLAAHGITHIVNCCGYVSKNYFEGEEHSIECGGGDDDDRSHLGDAKSAGDRKRKFNYMTLWLEVCFLER